jgi:hypothetical protein
MIGDNKNLKIRRITSDSNARCECALRESLSRVVIALEIRTPQWRRRCVVASAFGGVVKSGDN